MPPLNFAPLNRKKKINQNRNELYTLINNIDGLGNQSILDDPLIHSKFDPIPIIEKRKCKTRRNNKYRSKKPRHYNERMGNSCKMCNRNEDTIDFYHKLALISVTGLLLKFIIDSLLKK